MKFKVFFGITAISLFACVSNDLPLIPVHGYLNKDEIVKEHQAIVYDVPNGEIRIEVVAIQDSRCPIDAFCVWEGYSQVTFGLVPLPKRWTWLFPRLSRKSQTSAIATPLLFQEIIIDWCLKT